MKLSEMDEVMIRYADTLSPAAIAFKLEGALTPEQVMARINHLVDSPDWLDAQRQDRLVTLKMRQVVSSLEEMTLTTRSAEVLIRGLEVIGNRLDKRAEATDRDLKQLYAFQGGVMLDAVNAAMAHMRGRLTGGDKLSEEEWDDALESSIRFAQLEVAKHEAVGS